MRGLLLLKLQMPELSPAPALLTWKLFCEGLDYILFYVAKVGLELSDPLASAAS